MQEFSPIQKKFLQMILYGRPFEECVAGLEKLISDGLRDPDINTNGALEHLQTKVEEMGRLQKEHFLTGLFLEWGWSID